jgi:hypothetical protein
MPDMVKMMLIPKELDDLLKKEILRLWTAKAPLEEAIQKGVKIFNDYWREKHADKSGG